MTLSPSFEQISQDAVRLRDALPMDDMLRHRRIAIYGTGFLGHWAVDYLRGIGVEPVACFDGNPARHGTMFRDIEVRAFPDPMVGTLDGVLITARHAVKEIAPRLAQAGISAWSFDGWYVANHFSRFAEMHDGLFDDERSRETLRAVLHTMFTGERGPLGDVFERDQYFCLPHFIGAGRERYVDAGAYVGDSIERFIWANAGVFEKIRAFEPFPRQYSALRTRMQRLIEEWAVDADSIEMNQLGLGARAARMAAGTGNGQLQNIALAEAEDGDVHMVSLDEHLDGQSVTFIKADVEGMEMQLLAGAERTITAHRPRLAICVYHYPSDIPEISARIRSYVPEYRFALRHHSPQLMETVLYAWTD